MYTYDDYNEYDDEEYQPDDPITIPSTEAPNSRHKVALNGYTGYRPHGPHVEDTERPTHRIMIRGYQGHVHGTKNLCGVPLIPGVDEQTERLAKHDESKENKSLRVSGHLQDKVEQSTLGSSFTNFRSYGQHMELEERYTNAIQQLWKRGQTPQMLLRIVQSKLSERVNSYAHQRVRARKIFEYFDLDNSATLDEHEFRQFLELSNCYMDDIQSLALFAYFDEEREGGIRWEQFMQHAMVQNPRGGTAVIPKAITATMEKEDWKSVAAFDMCKTIKK